MRIFSQVGGTATLATLTANRQYGEAALLLQGLLGKYQSCVSTTFWYGSGYGSCFKASTKLAEVFIVVTGMFLIKYFQVWSMLYLLQQPSKLRNVKNSFEWPLYCCWIDRFVLYKYIGTGYLVCNCSLSWLQRCWIISTPTRTFHRSRNSRIR
jgi:hypothetical protein